MKHDPRCLAVAVAVQSICERKIIAAFRQETMANHRIFTSRALDCSPEMVFPTESTKAGNMEIHYWKPASLNLARFVRTPINKHCVLFCFVFVLFCFVFFFSGKSIAKRFAASLGINDQPLAVFSS